MARDHGEPQKETTTYVEVTVKRDKGSLRFSSNNYRVTISENKPLNSNFIRLNAQPSVSRTMSNLSCMSHVARISCEVVSLSHAILLIF